MLVVGHRGDRQRFPDNTIEGLTSAFELGADGIDSCTADKLDILKWRNKK